MITTKLDIFYLSITTKFEKNAVRACEAALAHGDLGVFFFEWGLLGPQHAARVNG